MISVVERKEEENNVEEDDEAEEEVEEEVEEEEEEEEEVEGRFLCFTCVVNSAKALSILCNIFLTWLQ